VVLRASDRICTGGMTESALGGIETSEGKAPPAVCAIAAARAGAKAIEAAAVFAPERDAGEGAAGAEGGVEKRLVLATEAFGRGEVIVAGEEGPAHCRV
jgi:hypothetical protein